MRRRQVEANEQQNSMKIILNAEIGKAFMQLHKQFEKPDQQGDLVNCKLLKF